MAVVAMVVCNRPPFEYYKRPGNGVQHMWTPTHAVELWRARQLQVGLVVNATLDNREYHVSMYVTFTSRNCVALRGF